MEILKMMRFTILEFLKIFNRISKFNINIKLADGLILLNTVRVVTLGFVLFSSNADLFAYQVDASKYENLNVAVNSQLNDNSTIIVSTLTILNDNLTVPSNLALMVVNGGAIKLEGYSLTVNGPFIAGMYRCFYNNGTVRLGISSTPDVYPQWWGAKGDGVSDDSDAFIRADQAVGDAGQIRIPAGTYHLTRASNSRSTWILDSKASIEGFGGTNTNHRIFKIGNGGLWGGGTKVGATSNWLQTQLSSIAGRTSEDAAELIVLSHSGNIGGVFGSRTSDNNLAAGSEGTISQASFAINDNTIAPQTSYAIYGDSIRNKGTGTTHFLEGNIINRGSVIDIAPNSPFVKGSTHNLWVASGGQVKDAKDASSAIGIVNNGAKFRKGIVFHQNALFGSDGHTGLGEAISFGKGHFFQWYNSVGNNTSAIIGNVDNHFKGTKIIFDNTGFNITNVSGEVLFNVPSTEGKITNYPQFIASSAGFPTEIRAVGEDINVGLNIKTKGNGRIGFYTGTQETAPISGDAGSLPASPAGYLCVIINGVKRLIPYY